MLADSLRHLPQREVAQFDRFRLVEGCQIGSLPHRLGTYRALLCISEPVDARLAKHVPGQPHCNPDSHTVSLLGC